MVGGTTCEGWGQSSMLVDNGVGVETGTGSTGSVGDEGLHFGVAPNVEQTLLVAGKEASLVANMTVFLCHRYKEEYEEIWGKGVHLVV